MPRKSRAALHLRPLTDPRPEALAVDVTLRSAEDEVLIVRSAGLTVDEAVGRGEEVAQECYGGEWAMEETSPA